MLKGGSTVIGVTGRRLILQPLDRRGDPEGPARSIAPEQITTARAGPAGGGWINVDTAILDHAAVRLEIRTSDGEKTRLMLMRGEGKILGALGGGEPQRLGLEALAGWFRANDPS
jgi:hypothetical protein